MPLFPSYWEATPGAVRGGGAPGAPTQTNINFSLTILCTIILEMSFYLHKLKQLHYNYNNYLICSPIPQSVGILISTFLQLVFVCNCIEPLETRKDWEISEARDPSSS